MIKVGHGIVAGILGVPLIAIGLYTAPPPYKTTPGFINHVTYQVADFCSATSIEDRNLVDGLQGIFLTAAHCTDKGVGQVLEVHNQYGSFKAIVIDYDQKKDLAILSSLKPLEFEIDYADIGDKVSFGEHVRNSGYAFGLKSKYYTEGWVAEELEGKTYASMSAAGGQSGSGVFNDAGELVGVVQAGYQTQMESQSMYSLFAIVSDIKEFVNGKSLQEG